MKYLKYIGVVAIVVLFCLGVYKAVILSKDNIRTGAIQFLQPAKVLAGSTSVFVGAPTSTAGSYDFYKGDATTTQMSAKWTQYIPLNGMDKLRLNISAIGGTATSTLYIRPMVSADGTNYYYPIDSFQYQTVTTTFPNTTTTLPTNIQTMVITPGTATTSLSYLLNFAPAKHLRLMFMGDDVALDPNDGIKAYIEYELQEGLGQ